MQNLSFHFNQKNSRNALVFNLALWLVSYFVLLFFFAESFSPQKIDYIYTGAFVFTIIIPVIINLYVLIPFLLSKERYLLFFLLFLANLLLFTETNKWFFNSYIDVIFPDYYFVSYHSNTTLFIIFSVFLVGTTLVKLASDWFQLNKVKNELLRNENIEIQNRLTSLKSQINPHFLFNSLNVLYSLSLEEKEETSSAILQLSHILRYVLYETADRKISLKKEVELIQKYLEFQKYRYHDSANVSFETDIQDLEFLLYPMLLLPLIENSFKHGIKGEVKNTFINIKLTQNRGDFYFYIENNISDGTAVSDDQYSGLGLQNIQQNLALVYPNSHSFEITESEKSFAVSLKISTHED
ncbi:histidine kinase [Pseudotenacibaculum sp. MALMAid0570]|uniref:sensor histidine kinase n=1 Tax=Pseudotenacibaculum sp. MALMAid0570 TaxID=3143938 RepID=UPI0032DFDDC2